MQHRYRVANTRSKLDGLFYKPSSIGRDIEKDTVGANTGIEESEHWKSAKHFAALGVEADSGLAP